MNELIERMADWLIQDRITDCAYGECASLADIARQRYGQTFTYDTTRGIDTTTEPNRWVRVEVVPTDEEWNRAAEIAAQQD